MGIAMIDAKMGAELFCPECQYDLRGIESTRCPECGTVFDRATLAAGRLPWLHRRRMGRIRAYLATLWLVMIHPFRLAGEAGGPVNRREAVRFRAVTIGLTFATVLVAGTGWLLYWWSVYQRSGGECFIGEYGFDAIITGLTATPGSWALSLLAALMFLITATGVAEWFMHPRRLNIEFQNRGVALSQYASAPLCLLPALLAAGSAYLWLTIKPGGGTLGYHVPPGVFGLLAQSAWLLTLALAAAIPLSWLFTTLVLMRRVTQAGMGRLIAAAVAMPILWALLAAGWFFGLHGVVSFLLLVWRSLWG